MHVFRFCTFTLYVNWTHQTRCGLNIKLPAQQPYCENENGRAKKNAQQNENMKITQDVFKCEWESLYIFVERNSKPFYLICQASQFKASNLQIFQKGQNFARTS